MSKFRSIPDLWRAVLIRVLGWRYVVLVDNDGDRHVRRIKWRGGEPYASRLGFGVRNVWLLDGGSLLNGAYVKRWEPYDPGAERRWPKHSALS